ncbi:Dos2-interacting transcription regulator of RNA-Pol-II-like protein [Elsinoe fawcettii]|nr:Dos2-interacting transcription regulator of RNA-Pol-II-like protein [Elsinoe fawcettii]
MSDIQLYLVEAGKNKDEARKIAQETAAKLERKEIQLLALIESIGEYINNEDPTLRTNSIAFLADTLDSLSSRVLSLQQRLLLTEFILSRMEDDSDGTPACARALTALEKLGKWDAETVKKIVSTIVLSTQSLRQFKLQAERYAILQLLDLLLAKYRQAINQRAEDDFDFINSFTSYFEGEKDPRNLMIVFSVVMVPMSEWNLGPSTQDMFELVFNYFPITFKPPPGDPFGITAQDLKDRLRACIASTSEFAPYSFPALLDKLDSSSMNTKRDVLQALIACITNYEPRTISLYSVTLWDALKFEILNMQEQDLADSALEALSAIAQQLPLASEGALNAYLKPIIKECNEHLEDAPTKQSEAAGKILFSMSTASPEVADFIIKGVLPALLTLFQASESIAKRRGLVEVLNKLFAAVDVVSDQWQTRDDAGIITNDRASTHALRAFTADFVNLLLQAVVSAPKSEISFRLYSLEGLELMLKIRQLLSPADTEQILDACTDIIIQEASTATDEIKAGAVKTIIAAAQQHPKTAVEKALPALVAQLPDSPEAGIFTYEPALEVLAKLSVEPALADTVIVRLKNKLNTAKRLNAPRSYVYGLLTSLLYIFTNGNPSRDAGVIRINYFTELVLPVLEEAIGLATAENPLLSSEACVDIIGRVSAIITRDQSQHTQNQVFSSTSRIFDSLKAESLTPESAAQQKRGSKLGVIASLYLHAAFTGSIYQDEVPNELLKALTEIATDTESTSLTHTSALRHLTLLVNKFIPPASLQAIIDGLKPGLLDVSAVQARYDVELAFAILKGLVVSGKSSKTATQILDSLLRLLSTQHLGEATADGLGGLLAPDDLVSKENHCNISGLYRQRIYNQCYNAITSAIKSVESDCKPNYLVALSGILRSLPYDIIKPSLSAIAPLLLQCLDLKDPSQQKVKASALVTIEAVLLHDPETLTEHTVSLVTRLLASSEASANHEEVRAGALRCLKLLPTQFKRETVIPQRRQVIRKLLVPLDDKKRSVRAEAVRCRSAWLALDQEDEDEG